MAAPTVRTRQGVYRGVLLAAGPAYPGLPKAVEAFRGIPYARVTPGAEGRFRPALSPSQSCDTFDATEYGPLCPTFASAMEVAEGWTVSEDCLNASVFRPARSNSDAKMPVLVYFHGGGFNFGKGAERDMVSFVGHAGEDVTAVSFNYRLGPLGFLSSGTGEAEGCLNLGLRDQRALLQWVKDNIHEFGGDEDNVTVMGVSAGAHSVSRHDGSQERELLAKRLQIGHHILAADPAHPLFHKAILESGAATARFILAPTHPRQESQFRDLLASCGISSNLEPKETLDLLRSIPLERLLSAAAAVWLPNQDSLRWPFQPTIDKAGGTILDLPLRLSTSSPPSGALVPVITGFNSHEGAAFLAATKACTTDDFAAFFETLIPGLSAADLEELAALYPDPADAASDAYLPRPPGVAPQFCRLAAAYGDQAYVAPVLLTAHRNAQAGTPAYVYEFAARGDPFAAANHGSEGDVVAHDLESLGAHEGLLRVSEMMHGLFSRLVSGSAREEGELALSGADGDEVRWPRFDSPFVEGAGPEMGAILVFGEGNDERAGGCSHGSPTKVRTLSALEVERCRFWWDRMPLSQGMASSGQ